MKSTLIKFITLNFLLTIFCIGAEAQSILRKASANFEIQEFNLDKNQNYAISFQKKALAISIVVSEGTFEGSYFTAGNKKIFIKQGHDANENTSELIFFNLPIDTVILFSGFISGKAEVHAYYPEPVWVDKEYFRISQENCSEPASIPPSVWRKDLPPPSTSPDSSKVEHIIIHHSATDPGTNNPTDVVRSIYLFHTQTNKWADIGYNFLVSPDGSIFQGRDEKGLYQKDNVIGAHLCAKNTNTMGICVLGNYMQTSPTESAIESVVNLVTWKTEKEKLDPFGSSFHPNSSSTVLPNVAGHRDGCATECPGTHLYNRLSEIRTVTSEQRKNCAVEGSGDLIVYPNPAYEFLNFKNLPASSKASLFDMTGKMVFHLTSMNNRIDVSWLPKGVYLLVIEGASTNDKLKLLKY